MDATLIQDNRITSAHYELSLMEKRILYVLIKDIRNRYVANKQGNKTLFDDFVIKTTSSKLLKDLKEKTPKRVKSAFKTLRLKSFE